MLSISHHCVAHAFPMMCHLGISIEGESVWVRTKWVISKRHHGRDNKIDN